MGMRETGLRESKKAATRLALATALLRHTSDGALDSVSVETVAAEVGVSVRTFHNYFPNKEDAFLYFVGLILERLADLVEERPPAETLWQAMTSALRTMACDPDAVPAHLVTLIRLLDADPGLAERQPDDDPVVVHWIRLANTLCHRQRVDELGLFERLVVANAVSTVRLALQMWVADLADTTDLYEYLTRAFDISATGLSR